MTLPKCEVTESSASSSEASVRNKNTVQRTGHWNTDLLHLYESSILYDCTFEVGAESERGGCKVWLEFQHFTYLKIFWYNIRSN